MSTSSPAYSSNQYLAMDAAYTEVPHAVMLRRVRSRQENGSCSTGSASSR